MQQLGISGFILVLFLFIFYPDSLLDYLLVILLSINIIYLFIVILPFTALGVKQLKTNKNFNKENSIRLMVANVYQDNIQYDLCKKVISDCDPDVLMLVETDVKWQENLKSLEENYPYRISNPLKNTYGLMFFSKLKLENEELKYLVLNEVPSIYTKVQLRGGQKIVIYGLHPKPPVPTESDTAEERDAEILLVGKEAKNCELPVIVCGDLNDVAWSYTTNLFLKISQLLDPRRGRGMFNTFNAKYFLLRWPLDHFFCSKHFTLKNIERLPSIGSDHFPICITLCLDEAHSEANEVEKADAEEKQEAEEKIKEGER